MLKFHSKSLSETIGAGKVFGKKLKGGEVIALSGELGAGKTSFVKGLVQGLRVAGKVKSPSFVILQEYPRNKTTGLNFFHLDLYRLKHSRELRDLGISEILKGRRNVIAVEWPEKAKQYLPKHMIFIKFSNTANEHERIIKFK